jgi:membrane-associated progesterone receptor component
MAMAEWWAAATEAVAAYTGLTPAAFFTAVAVAAALYVAVSGLLARPAQTSSRRQEEAAEERAFEPLPPPVQLGEVTEQELRTYDGSDPKKPLLMAIKGQIYDVTQSRYVLSSLLNSFDFVPHGKTWNGDTRSLAPLKLS